MATSTYTVTGMTCSNCENHVREEVRQIAGVLEIDVSADEGRLTITTEEAPVDDAAVIAAVDEAGYTATPAR